MMHRSSAVAGPLPPLARHTVLLLKVVAASCLLAAAAAAQADQHDLSRRLLQEDRVERSRAFSQARALQPEQLTPELRNALMATLAREGLLHARRRRGETGFIEEPELIAQVAEVVSNFRDPRSIPALVSALGTSSPAMYALAEFGELAAAGVLEIADASRDGSVLMDALVVLRMMVEDAEARPLEPATRNRMRDVAEQRLRGGSHVITLLRAIDLAVALKDPLLIETVQAIASDSNAVVARRISDPWLIRITQQWAADRLAGVPARPRPRSPRGRAEKSCSTSGPLLPTCTSGDRQ